MSRLEKALMNLTEMIDEMNTNITESQISITQVVDELLEERTKVSQLDKTAKELFTLNDQVYLFFALTVACSGERTV